MNPDDLVSKGYIPAWFALLVVIIGTVAYYVMPLLKDLCLQAHAKRSTHKEDLRNRRRTAIEAFDRKAHEAYDAAFEYRRHMTHPEEVTTEPSPVIEQLKNMSIQQRFPLPGEYLSLFRNFIPALYCVIDTLDPFAGGLVDDDKAQAFRNALKEATEALKEAGRLLAKIEDEGSRLWKEY